MEGVQLTNERKDPLWEEQIATRREIERVNSPVLVRPRPPSIRRTWPGYGPTPVGRANPENTRPNLAPLIVRP
jgi:hypothetical protein